MICLTEGPAGVSETGLEQPVVPAVFAVTAYWTNSQWVSFGKGCRMVTLAILFNPASWRSNERAPHSLRKRTA